MLLCRVARLRKAAGDEDGCRRVAARRWNDNLSLDGNQLQAERRGISAHPKCGSFALEGTLARDADASVASVVGLVLAWVFNAAARGLGTRGVWRRLLRPHQTVDTDDNPVTPFSWGDCVFSAPEGSGSPL